MLKPGSQCYFIGIGGIAMSQAALLLHEMGYRVRGSDSALHPPTDQLLHAAKIAVEERYSAAHLNPPPDLVVIGNAVSRGNPEVEEVLAQGIPYLSLPLLIKELLLTQRRSAVVAGTHGKTTTASLLAWLLVAGGLDPSFLVGGLPLNFGRGYRAGAGGWAVLEGDEYDSAFFDKGPKFLHYQPSLVILTSIEFDHADIYPNLEVIKDAFRRLIAIVPSGGTLIACNDDPVVREVIAGAQCRVETYGQTGMWSPREPWATAQGTIFSLQRGDKKVGEMELEVPLWGEHNISNVVAAVAAARRIGLSFAQIRKGLLGFQGVRRRMETIGEAGGITVIDDFAHHPTAVRETLRALRSRFPGRRLWAVFEPRSHTMRRNVLQEELALALTEADRVVLGRPFSPRAPEETLDPERVVAEINRHKGAGVASYLKTTDQIVSLCVAEAVPRDVIAVMSSGHFEGLPMRILSALRDRA
jgi:UDP-N-acetylmuramate: L-alanyl-gamma-D-glutamyl-meso-diaminopimelate ligase